MLPRKWLSPAQLVLGIEGAMRIAPWEARSSIASKVKARSLSIPGPYFRSCAERYPIDAIRCHRLGITVSPAGAAVSPVLPRRSIMSHTLNHAVGCGACVLLGGQAGAIISGATYQRPSGKRPSGLAAQRVQLSAVGSGTGEICALVRPAQAGMWHGKRRGLVVVLRRWVQ